MPYSVVARSVNTVAVKAGQMMKKLYKGCIHSGELLLLIALMVKQSQYFDSVFFFFFFFFNSVYFSSYETGQSVGWAKSGEPREKPPGIPASRTWLVSHVASVGLEPTPDTAVK